MRDDNPPRGDNSPFSIVHIAPPQITSGGDFVYRLRQPDDALGRIPGVLTASITNIFSRRLELCLGADVLIVQLLSDPDLLPILRARRRAGRPTVFEISDNFMNFQPSNPVAEYHDIPGNRACILQLIAESDAAQTTMSSLKEMFSRYNPRIEVFENQIETPGAADKPGGPVVVGWGGSVGHYDDIREAAPAIVNWLNRRHDVHFSLMADPAFRELFAGAPQDRFHFTPPGSLQDFYAFVRTLHVGIAPLKDDPFNLCRSDVKFIEYASHGTVPVCSDAPTYNRTLRDRETGFLFSNLNEMISILDTLASDAALRGKVAKQAHEYIKTERSEQAAAARRLEFYRSLLPAPPRPGGLDETKLASIPSLKRTPGTAHYLHHFSDAELHVYNALVYLYAQGDARRAAESARAAAALDPDYYYAHFALGEALLNRDRRASEKSFRRAAGLFPECLTARMSLARLAAARNRKAEAGEIVRAIQRDCPAFAPAFALEAEAAFAENDPGRAAKLLESALAANPFYSPAAMRLGAMRLDAGDAESAAELFRGAAETLPRSAEARCGLAIALGELGRTREAAELFIVALALASDPEPFVEPFLKIALKFYKSGDYAAALELLNRALDAKPELPGVLFWAARVAERTGGKKAAAPYLKRLAEADTEGKYKKSYQNMEES
jgi:tetratricopeptide (TPR) repeat protein